MSKRPGPNKENLEATRSLFLTIARAEFSMMGYYDTSTASIVEKSGMARGSLYYHFGDKKGLFGAVYSALVDDLRRAARQRADTAEPGWNALIAYCLEILNSCATPALRRIIIDVHTALTYRERLGILSATLLEDLRDLLKDVQAQGYFKDYDPAELSLLIFGMISETGRSLELASDVATAQRSIGRTFIRLLEAARG